MNVRLLRRIAKVIQEKPELFNMLHFKIQTDCGTSHCIGGWAEHFTGKEATEALDLTYDQAERLFYVSAGSKPLWPRRFLGRKKKGLSNVGSWWRPTPKQAAARIEHFIKTKGAE